MNKDLGYADAGASEAPAALGTGVERQPITGVVLRSWHFTRWAARRARKRWLKSVRGRDAYIHRRSRFHWEVRRIDYAPLERAVMRLQGPGAGRRG